MKLLGIDPGLRATGFAIFELPPSGVWPADHDPLRNLSSSWELETDPAEHLAVRLAQIHSATLQTLRTHSPAVVIIETPATGGDYGGQKGRRSGTNLLYSALGAIQAAVGGALLEGVNPEDVIRYTKAPTSRKTKRHHDLKERAQLQKVTLPTGPRGGKLPNAWDAILCALAFLQERDP